MTKDDWVLTFSAIGITSMVVEYDVDGVNHRVSLLFLFNPYA